jgi:hypothetical protein
MPSRNQTFRIVFGGGWATDFGNVAEVEITPQGLVRVPYLLENLNNFFELDGGTHKIGGTVRMNAVQVASGEEIIGLYDFWKGAGGTASQKLVIHVGTDIMAADIDGEFASIAAAAFVNDSVPSYETFDDMLIIASDNTTDAPQKWTQAGNTSALHASAPNFSFSETHKNRLWGAGDLTSPSSLYYSSFVDPEDWTGAGSGTIKIDPDDGDGITGLASHKNDLWVFKGPYKGSIHRIVGSAPTGGDSFARQTFVRGIGAVWHNTIFRYRDDLGFMWSDGSVHSLAATAAFGDFREASLSLPINNWIRDNINGNRMKYVWAATDSHRGYVLFTIPTGTSTFNNHHLLMDYRFDPPRWAHWDAFTSGCVAEVVDSGVQNLFDGSNDGFVRRLQQSNRNVDDLSEIESKMNTAWIHFGSPHKKKYIERSSLSLVPKSNADVTFTWNRDNLPEQTQTSGQGATGDRLDRNFILNSSVLGGANSLDLFMSLEEGGDFRAIKIGARNLNFNEDLEVHGFSATVHAGADSGEN